MKSARPVQINREPVELYKLLKFEGLLESGGAAKHAVAEGLVRVNGQVETRKRKKLLAGDLIEFEGELMKLVLE